MIGQPPRILFVSHSASRNGATILLLHLLQWLRDHANYELEILMHGRGDLVRDFQEIGRTFIWRSPSAVFPAVSSPAWARSLDEQYLAFRMLGRHYDAVYLNTTSIAEFVPLLARHAHSALWHVHELDYVLKLTASEERFRELLPIAHRVIAVSESVRSLLMRRLGISQEKIDLVHGFIRNPGSSATSSCSQRCDVRRELGWPEDAFVVGACGALGWRKGTDLFLCAAKEMLAAGGDRVRFLWVGGASRDEALRFEYEVHTLGLQSHLQHIGKTSDVTPYYRAMDVFALTSREDPFPLVMLEAAACGIPVVCFADTGGGPEFVGDDAGLIVPYQDTVRFAACLETLRNRPLLLSRLGANAAEKVRRNHTVEKQAPKILTSIERCLSASRQIRLRLPHPAANPHESV